MSANHDSLAGEMTETFDSKGSRLLEALAEFYHCGFPLTSITGYGQSKRYQEVLISAAEKQPLIVRNTQPSQYRNSSLPVELL